MIFRNFPSISLFVFLFWGPLAGFSAEWNLDKVRDDTPFFHPGERDIVLECFRFLERTDHEELCENVLGELSYLQLYAQSGVYRGKTVAISGIVLRWEPVRFETGKNPPDANTEKLPIPGYYECWIRMDDRSEKPLSVLVLDSPEEFSKGDRIWCIGISWKRRLYSTGEHLETTPMILAKSLSGGKIPIFPDRTISESVVENPPGPSREESTENRKLDREFLDEIFGLCESEWESFSLVETPGDYPAPLIRKLRDRFQQKHVQIFLREPSHGLLAEISGEDTEQIRVGFSGIPRGFPVEISANLRIRSFEPLRISDEQWFLCDLSLAETFSLKCIVPKIPEKWKSPQIDPGESEPDSPLHLLDEKVGIFGLILKHEPEPVLLADRIRWYPETLLGKYGMDMGTLDAVPPLAIEQWIRESRSGKIPLKNVDLKTLRFTESDVEPFYQMLRAAARIPAKEINEQIREEEKTQAGKNFSVIDLFNRPHTQQGRLVRLSGNARRIDRIMVEDPEVKKRFGIDHYYQIAFFTPDSQNNPLVFCICEIPGGLPRDNDPSLNVPISLSGFFYKTWAYRKSGSSQDASEIQFAPLLIGAKVDWFQTAEPLQDKDRGPPVSRFPILAFLILVFMWIFIRRISRGSQSPRFRMKE